MKRLLLWMVSGVYSPWAWADRYGIDEAIAEGDGNLSNFVGGMFIVAILAFIIHLIEKGEFVSSLKDIAKGLSSLASLYLIVFLFFACIALVSLTLQSFGLSTDTSGLIALPLGGWAGWKILSAYQDWRHPSPKDES